MFELLVTDSFSAAHNLREYRGQCERLHGHNWKVEARVRGAKLGKDGMLADFRLLKDALARILERFDHKYINDDVNEFKKLNPTTENIARIIYKEMAETLSAGVSMASVTVWESEGCSSTYSEGGR